MQHCGTRRLESERLVLRKFIIEGAKAMFQNWASDSEVTKYLTWPAHGSMDVSKMVLEDWIAKYSNENFYQWAVGILFFSLRITGMNAME